MQTRSKRSAFLIGCAASVLAATAVAMPQAPDLGPGRFYRPADPPRLPLASWGPSRMPFWPRATDRWRHPVAPGFALPPWPTSDGCHASDLPAAVSLAASDNPRRRQRTPQHRHHYQVDFRNGGFVVAPRATNPQRPDWHWGLRLVGYGTPARLQRVANARVGSCAGRLELRRGAIIEWYENKPSGLEQGFTLHRAPEPSATDVILAFAINTNLRGEWARPDQSVGFVTASGEHALSYGDLKAFDADGKPLPARLVLGPNRLAIQVQVRDAAWPIVVDPLIAEPGEPILDWIETQHDLIPPATSVPIAVAWQRDYGDPATSVQYRLDGNTLLALQLDEDASLRGETVLDIDRPGEYELAVALCNDDGCAESEPVLITVADAAGTFLTGEAVVADLDPEAAEVQREAIIAASADAYAALEAKWGPRETWGEQPSVRSVRFAASTSNWINMGSNLLGRLVLGSTFNKDIFKSSVDLVFAMFTPASSDPVADALDEIQGQLTEIAAKIDAVLDQLKVMQENAAWYAFDTQDGFVRLGVGKVKNAADLIANWAENWEIYEDTGGLPTQEDFTYVKELLFEGVGDMETHLSSTSGAVKRLTEAVDMHLIVTDLEHYWSVIHDYIDYNKGVMARALASLRFLADHDTSPSFMSYVNTTVGRIEDAVRKMYGISGVPYPQVDGGKYIHAKDLDYAFTYYIATNERHGPQTGVNAGTPGASCGSQYTPCWLLDFTWTGGRPTFPSEHAQSEGGLLRGGFDGEYPEWDYSTRYDPSQHEGISLRQFLEQIGMSPWFHEARCWASYYAPGSGYCSEYYYWEVDTNGKWYRTTNVPNDGQPHPYRKLLSGTRNAGGRLANFDPNRIEEVAFGIQDFEVAENGSNITLKMTERSDRALVLIDAANGATLGSTPAANPGSIVIPASGNAARTITVLSQPVVPQGATSATFAESSFVIDSTQAVTVAFEIEEK